MLSNEILKDTCSAIGVEGVERPASGLVEDRKPSSLGPRMTDEELQEMIDEADRDGDGEINEEEFLRIMKKTSLY